MRAGFRDGLRPAQWQALRFFADNPGESLTEFARHRHSTTGSASVVVSALVKRDYLARQTRHSNRNVGIQLTEAGRQALEQDPIKQLIAALQTLPEEQLATFQQALTQLRRDLSERIEDDET
jgi:DNA-binding MarR family transcriptional regulator